MDPLIGLWLSGIVTALSAVLVVKSLCRKPWGVPPEQACVHCGYAAPSHAEFCPRCGELVRHETPETHPEYCPSQVYAGGVMGGRYYKKVQGGKWEWGSLNVTPKALVAAQASVSRHNEDVNAILRFMGKVNSGPWTWGETRTITGTSTATLEFKWPKP